MSVEFELYFSLDVNYENLLEIVPKEFECLDQGEFKTSNMILTISEPDEDDLEDLSLDLDKKGINNLFSFTLKNGMDVIGGQNEIIRVVANVIQIEKCDAILVVGGSSLLMQRYGDLITLYDKEFWSDERVAMLSGNNVKLVE